MACLLHCFYNLTKCDRQNPTAFLKSEFKDTSNEKRGKLCENKQSKQLLLISRIVGNITQSYKPLNLIICIAFVSLLSVVYRL